jgi:pimeloyl-[acyl-carrier protein] synthase
MSAEPLPSFDSMAQVMGDPEVRADPYRLYRQMREEAPRLRNAYGYVLTGYADCHAVLRDPRLSSSQKHQEGYPQFAQMVEQLGFGSMLFADPPDHTRLRRLASKAFTPRAVEAMRPHIEELVDGMLDAVEERGEMDVVADLAYPVPVIVISEMLGVPLEDRERFHRWTADAVKVLDPSDDFSIFPAACAAFDGYRDYFLELIEERRRRPGDDLLTALVEAEEEGDRLTEEELVAMVTLLFVAGHETTVNLIGNGLHALLRRPDERDRLVDDPSLVPLAVEEMLRFDPPVQVTGRNAVVDVDLGDDCTIRRGEQVVVVLAAANRDPGAFDADPERFDAGRRSNRHLSFGGGIHLCLGAPLARVEAQVAVGSLLRRFPALELADDDPPRKETVTLRGFASLRVGW